MYNYQLVSPMPRCDLKIDIRKAFDTVSWEFILTALRAIGVSGAMVRWIEVCIYTTHFYVAMNGKSHGFFPSSRVFDKVILYLLTCLFLAMKGLEGILRDVL